MAMARSSFNGMWNYTCEGGTYLCAQGKNVATFMFQTWRRGLLCLLLLGSLPFLAPMILVSMMVGGIFLVPLLCVGTAYYALFHPSSLSSIMKWFRSPRSVLRSASRSTELTMEDFAVHDDEFRSCEASPETSNLDLQSADREMLDVDSEYVIVANEADTSDDGEPYEPCGPRFPSHASGVELDADELASAGGGQEIVDESKTFDVVQKEEEDQRVTALSASENMQDDEIATSGVTVSDGSTKDTEEEPSHKESAAEFPSESPLVAEGYQQLNRHGAVHEKVHEEVHGEEMDKAFNHAGSNSVQERENLISTAPFYREPVEEGDSDPENTQADNVSEDSLPDENSLGKYSSREEVSMGVEDPTFAEEAASPEADELITKSEVTREVESEREEVPVVQGREAELPSGVSEPVSDEKEAPVLVEEDESMAAPALESDLPLIEQQSLPVNSEPVELAFLAADVPTIAEAAEVEEAAPTEAVAPVENVDVNEVDVPGTTVAEEKDAKVAALDEEAVPTVEDVAEKVEEPDASVLEEKEVEAFVGEVATPENDASIAEPEVPKEVEGRPEEALAVLEKEVLPLVVSEPASEEDEAPVTVEEAGVEAESEAEAAPSLESELVESASSVEDVPAIAEATSVQEAASAETTAPVEELDVEELEVPEFQLQQTESGLGLSSSMEQAGKDSHGLESDDTDSHSHFASEQERIGSDIPGYKEAFENEDVVFQRGIEAEHLTVIESSGNESLEAEHPILEYTVKGFPLEHSNIPADAMKPAENNEERKIVDLDGQLSEVGEDDERIEAELNGAQSDSSYSSSVSRSHPKQMNGSEITAKEVDGSDTYIPTGDQQHEEDDELENGEELNESKLPAFDHVMTGVVADHQDSFELELEEPKRLKEGLAEAQSASEDPLASREPEHFVESKAFEGTQVEGQPAGQLTAPSKELVYLEESEGHIDVLEEPGQVQFDNEHPFHSDKQEQLEGGLRQPESVPEDSTASGDLEHLVEGVEEKVGEGHPTGQLTALGKEEERFDKNNAANEEPGQSLSASTQPLIFKGKPEHSEHGMPLKQVVQQVDETGAIEGESEISESASETFTPSENEQEQVDVLEPNKREFKKDTIHHFESNAGSSLEEFVAEEDVPVDQVKKAPVVQTKKDESASRLEDEAEAAPALELEIPVMEEESVQVEKGALLEESTSVEVSAPMEEVVAEKVDESELQVVEVTEVPESQVVEETEVPASQVVEEAPAPMAEEAPIADSEMTKQADVEPCPPEIHFEETPVVQGREAELPSGVSEPVSDEKEAPVLVEEDESMAAPALESDLPLIEQQSLPVNSEPVELAFLAADVPTIAEAAEVEEAAPTEAVAPVENVDVNEVDVPGTTVAEEKDAKVAALDEEAVPTVEDVAEKVEEPDASVLEEKEVEAFVGEVATPENDASIAEPEVPKEVEGRPEEAPAVLEKEVLPLVVSEPASEEDEAPVTVEEAEAELVESASSVEDVAAIVEATSVQEAASAETTAPVEELDVEGVEESKAPVVEDKEAEAFVEEPGALKVDAVIAEHELTKGPEAGSAAAEVLAEEAPIVQENNVEPPLIASTPVLEVRKGPVVAEAGEAAPASEPEASVVEKKSLAVEDSFPMEEAVPAIEEVASVEEPVPIEGAAPLEEGVAQKVEELETPVVKENETEASFPATEEMKVEEAPVAEVPAEDGAAPEVVPFAEPELTKRALPDPAAPECFSEGDAPVVQEKKVELPLPVPEPLPEVPTVEEVPAALGSEPVAPLIAEKSLPVEEAAPVEVAALEEPAIMKLQEPELPVIEKEEAEAALADGLVEEKKVELVLMDEASGEQHKVDLDPEAETPMKESDVTKNIEDELAAPKVVAEEDAPGVQEVELCVTVPESGLEGKGAAVPAVAPGLAPEAPMIAEKALSLQEIAPVDNFEKDEAAEGSLLERNNQDVFPTLRSLNVAHGKQCYDEQSEESNSFLNSAPAQRQISFKIAGGEEVKGTNFIFKSRLERDHPSHRHSAPDFLGAQTWARELPLSAPQDKFRSPKKTKYKRWSEAEGVGKMVNLVRPARSYSASATDNTEPHMGEFESLLQSWQERDEATHVPATSSPSGSPIATSPAMIGHQIREEINTIQRIIGQVLPPQHSLWKEVEILCQIVGMELPYMGDVSDLAKARHGLDLLKVVVGIK